MAKHLSKYLYAGEEQVVAELLGALSWDQTRAANVNVLARGLVEDVRARKKASGQLESFLQQYSLNTQEGLALMTLAEALLRIPDKDTADALIKDKVAAANWLDSVGESRDWIVKAAGVGLLMTRKTLEGALSSIGEPIIREAMLKAMRMMGEQFVLGKDIEAATMRAQDAIKNGYRMSYDILGEGARTAIDAEHYFENYAHAITYVGKNIKGHERKYHGVSIKLSALHPRYEFAQSHECVPAMVDKVSQLVKKAMAHDIPLVIDAEEVDRLDLSLHIIEQVIAGNNLSEWNGFGLAVQAYQKRAMPLLEQVVAMAKLNRTRLRVRLVKGAYWDTEIKRAQVLGLPDYPVFTRKANTDVSYLACTQFMLGQKEWLYPMLATHNAHTIAAVLEMAHDMGHESLRARAGGQPTFEFQRLHGMGEGLYEALKQTQDVRVSIYAPVGPQKDLLAYLVRRLLENGANTSFVNRLLDEDEPVGSLVADPVEKVRYRKDIRHPKIPLPVEMFEDEALHGRRNSKGLDLSDPMTVERLNKAHQKLNAPADAISIINGKTLKDGSPFENKNPARPDDNLGFVWPLKGRAGQIEQIFERAKAGYKSWSRIPAETRAQALDKFADLLEDQMQDFMVLLTREAGKTQGDARDEVREAVDFARYYANRGRMDCAEEGIVLPGPTGESNRLKLEGRGVFVCISPWNFPLAIFSGQVLAALMAGNAVIAKPASQTPLVAMKAVQLMHKAGIPKDVLNLTIADGRFGAQLLEHPDVAGVAFTGSTGVARGINQALAAKNGPIVPLIAETGGQNAMIVDSTALPEQVIDDVVLSAFGSAGQRCSALRILCLQDDIADQVIRMLKGAMAELRVGDPAKISTDIGPVIDEQARGELVRHRRNLEGFGKMIYEVPTYHKEGSFMAPCAFEIEAVDVLDQEHFGPILHVVRFARSKLSELIDEINATGYGLTFGVHSRLDSFQQDVADKIQAGNIYINRSMTGAVVGVQPFGGMGLSGTGPKAGGPNYLKAFAHEKTISIDTTAAGGNASLVSLSE